MRVNFLGTCLCANKHLFTRAHDDCSLCCLDFHTLLSRPPSLIVTETDYGDKDNDDLRARYNINKDNFPVFMLFKGSATTDPLTFTGAVKKDDLIRWIKQETGVWVGLKGCLQVCMPVSCSSWCPT